jgi:predicted amidohydrolase YtcJ
MRVARTLLLAALVSCGGEADETVKPETAPAAAPPPAEAADAVYTNGKIYTVNEAQPWAEAVAIKDGKFLLVGSNAEVEAVTGTSTEIVDLGGSFAMPGIGDTHIHPGLLMAKRAFCALPGTFYEPTEQDILDALEQCIEGYPEARPWFIAQGHSSAVMSPETLSREVLDRLIPDRPAWIEDESGHNAWFNTLAMEAAGVSKDFKDTPEEFFSRTKDGDLAGVAYEGAMNPFLEVLPPFDTELRKTGFLKLLDEASSKGITAAGDGYVFDHDLEAWQQLKQEGRLNQHVILYLKGNLGTQELTPVETLNEWWSSYDLPGHKAVKLGMGGAIESTTEVLVDGYYDRNAEATDSWVPGAQEVDPDADPGVTVRPIIRAEKFADYVAQLDAAGFQVMVHAIGDGTVRATLDGFETVITKNGNNRLRHHIDHCSLVHPDDFSRFVELHVSCTIWPPLNAPVAYNLDGIKPKLKPETWDRMYANRSMWDAGIRLVNHTDAPAAVLWPWWGMEASVTRGFPGKLDVAKMGPQHALTVEEVIEAYTINAAWALLLDHVTGSIEKGKFADFIVLNHNLFEIPETDIHKTEVQKTIFKGRVVYQEG